MGTSGSPWIVEKDVIIAALKKAKGRISHASKTLDVHPYTLRKRIKEHPDLVELLSDLRNHFEEDLLDAAEDCITQAMDQPDINHALKAAMYTLNSRGKGRNWCNTYMPGKTENNALIQGLLDLISGNNQEIPTTESSSRPHLEDQQPLLD